MNLKKMIALISTVSMLSGLVVTTVNADPGDNWTRNGDMEMESWQWETQPKGVWSGWKTDYAEVEFSREITHGDSQFSAKVKNRQAGNSGNSWALQQLSENPNASLQQSFKHTDGSDRTVSAGTKYLATAYVYPTADDTFILATMYGGNWTPADPISKECKANEWTELKGYVTIPADNTGSCSILILSKSTLADFYVDDISFIEQSDDTEEPTEQPTEEPTEQPTEEPSEGTVLINDDFSSEDQVEKYSYYIEETEKDPLTTEWQSGKQYLKAGFEGSWSRDYGIKTDITKYARAYKGENFTVSIDFMIWTYAESPSIEFEVKDLDNNTRTISVVNRDTKSDTAGAWDIETISGTAKMDIKDSDRVYLVIKQPYSGWYLGNVKLSVNAEEVTIPEEPTSVFAAIISDITTSANIIKITAAKGEKEETRQVALDTTITGGSIGIIISNVPDGVTIKTIAIE